MEALGQITGGIAHDFNNLLTPIVGGLGLLARKAELDPAARRLLESALSAGRRAAKLTGQLLAFSAAEDGDRAGRPRRPVRRDPAAARAGRAGVHIDMDDGGRGALRLHRRQPARAGLLNLVLNARDAMAGGTVSIAARPEPVRRGHGRMVTLEVRDTGEGMPRNVLRRAAEPFFTTKDAGSGTGPGLAQVYGIVRQSGGLCRSKANRASAPSSPSRPGCEPPAAVAAPEPESVAVLDTQDGQRILLCDDDDPVRTFVARVLDDAGFVVESVSDGRSAVQAVRTTPVSLLVVDFAMHGMNGADVAAARAFRPDLPVLMITGYADTDTVAEQAPGVPAAQAVRALLTAVRGYRPQSRTDRRKIGPPCHSIVPEHTLPTC